ncbi:DUF2911 domain-containing protein [Rhizosphaericola mali]|nr:DUF2911 domain-containing protein [Rhizosphaericola mali]
MQKNKRFLSTSKIIAAAAICLGTLMISNNVNAQKKKSKKSTSTEKPREDKSKRPSPPAVVSRELANGTKITIDYSQPSLKGRTPGVDVEPKEDTVWRAGANEATIFEVDKDVTINGQALPAGKYAFYVLKHGVEWTLIFNKVWNTWGTNYEKNKDQDALQVTVEQEEPIAPSEKLIYTISKDGKVSLLWGAELITFKVD